MSLGDVASIVQLALSVNQQLDQTSVNETRARELRKRLHVLLPLLRDLERLQTGSHPLNAVAKLQPLSDVLAELHNFLRDYDALREKKKLCCLFVSAPKHEQQLILLDARLSSHLADLSASNQHDVNKSLIHTQQQLLALVGQLGQSPGERTRSALDELMAFAESGAARLNPSFWLAAAVEDVPDASATLMRPRSLSVVAAPVESRLRCGDAVTLLLRSSVDAYAYAFHVGPDGSVLELLPNKHNPRDCALRAGEVRRFPSSDDGFAFSFDPPAGLETVYVFATLRPWPRFHQIFQAAEEGKVLPALFQGLTDYLRSEAAVSGVATCVHRFRTDLGAPAPAAHDAALY